MDTQQQKQFKILLIGDSCNDVYTFGTCTRLSPEAPVPIFVKHNSITQPGMVLNVKNNLEGLGCATELITHKEVITKERFVDASSNQQLLRIDDDCNVTQLTFNSATNFETLYDAIVVSDYNKGFIEPGVIKKIAKKAQNTNIPMLVDSKRKDLSCFEGCIIKLNKKEAESVTIWPKQYNLIVTHGKDGAVWQGKRFSAPSVEIHNVCGAGDTFLAGLTYNYLQTKNMEDALIFANKCAAIAVSKFGTYSITKDDLT